MRSVKRKILQWIAVGFTVFCLAVGILSGTGLYTIGEKIAPLRSTASESAQGESDVITASIEAQTVRDGVAQPSADGYVYFIIALDRAPEENVRVYYHTRDMSAIASEGDYDAVSDSVIFTPDSYSKVLAVKVYSKGVRIQGMERGEKNGNFYWGNYIENTRTFRVVLYRAESKNNCVEISGTKNALECSAGYSDTYEISYGGGDDESNAYYKMYYDNVTVWNEEDWNSPEIDGKKTWDSSSDRNGYVRLDNLLEKSPVFKQFIEAGIVTAVKAVLIGTVQDDNHWEYAGDMYVSVIHENAAVSPSERTEALKLVLNTDRMSAGSIEKLGVNGNIKSSVCSDKYIWMGSTSFLLPQLSGDDRFYFTVENPDNSDDVWLKLNLVFRPMDVKVPEIIGYYVQNDVRKGEKLGLSLRISEPVQVLNGAKPQIKALINGSMLNEVTFQYASGNGTDTLYFEADIPDSLNKQITSIRVQDILNISQIREYTHYHQNEKGEWLNWGGALVQPSYTAVRCNVDLRVPSVSVPGNLSTAAMRRAEVSLTLDNVGEDARLFYSWTDSVDTPSEYGSSATNLSGAYTVVGSNMNGKKWLHVKVVSVYGKESKFVRGPYLFDNSPPVVTANLADTSTLTQKDFCVTVSDGASGQCAGTDKSYMLISASADGSSAISKVLNGAGDAEKTFSLTAADVGLGKDEYGVFYIGFYAVDTIGNQTEAEDIIFTPYRFDRRDFFSASFEKAESAEGENVLLDTTSDGKYVIDCTKTPVIYLGYDGVEDPIVESFKKIDGSDCGVFPPEYQTTDGKKFIKIIPSDGVTGYAELYLSAIDGGTKKISDVFCFYFTKGGKEATAHYTKVQSGTLLLNEVYQLPENSSFYYKDAEGVVRTALYGNTALPASFSSSFEAKRYVYYTELQDLYAVKITAAQANWLNEGSTSNYVKAKNESVTAVEGQVWIRYKSATWETSSSSNAWVYYYYGPSETTIDTNRLSDNLLDALETVSARIVGYGKTVHLVGEGKLNALGEPYLAPAQVHVAQESASRSASGTVFASDVSYGGDREIYASSARVDGTDYAIATNLPLTFGAYTKLYYKSVDSSEFKEIVKGSGSYLSDVLLVSGVYEIKELDENGMRVFSVYVDANAPVLNALILDASGESRSVDFDEHADGVTYNAKIVMFNGIDAKEKDDYAYIAVYKYITSTSGTLLNVYTKEYLSQNGVVLDDGNYHIEVADRSGNSYSFVLRIDSTGLVCSVSEEPNAYVRVTCNRAKEQIASYEVVCNGKLLTSTYSASAKYTQSGYYEIYIRDIYGNEFNESWLFERSIPTVSWKYNVNGGYVVYDDETTTQMRISQSGDRIYVVTTSALLQFSYTEGYSFSSNVEWSENPITHAQTMKSLSAFVLSVWYTEYPDVSVTYICSVDNTPPNITARRETVLYALGETEELREKIAAGNVGDELTYSSIGYSQSSVSERFISDGETVSSRFIRLSINDASGVAKVTVYLDGKVFLEETENFSNVVLSRYGKYRVEAADTFGNVSSFSFVNRQISSQAYFVDGEEMDSDYSCLEYFRDGVYTKKDYGNGSAALKLYGDGEIVWKITRGDTQTVTAFSVENGELYVLTYQIVLTESGTKNGEAKRASLLSVSDPSKKADTWYRVLSKGRAGVDIFACFDKEGNITVKVAIDGTESVIAAEGRVYTGADREPFYCFAELSAERSDVALLFDEDEEIETNREERQIRINRAFTVSPDCAADGKVVSVKVYYSAAGAFSDYVSVYDGEYHAATFADEGMYLVEIENVYGNVTRYYLILSDKFVVTATAEFADGKTESYSSDYDEAVYANEKVILTAYAENIAVSVTKDGNPFRDMTVKEENGVTVVTIEGDGEYVVTLTDEFGNAAVREVAILSRPPAADDGLLYGYNDAALKRDEGYTNRRLSVSAERLQSDGFVYVAVEYAGKTTVLYDLIGEVKTPLDPDGLLECVGVSGDGEYAVVFRDVYGNRLASIVHYCGTPTLMISRTTRNSVEQEACDLSAATKNGVWSNSALHFASAAEEYVFTVDGKSVPCPYTLLFGSSAEEGSFSYEVTYTDAYGFSYELTAHLYRRKIELALTSQNVTTIEGVPTTREEIVVRIPEGATAFYSLDGGAEMVYAAGTTLYKDGTYRFTAIDAAGNVAALTVKKDSAVEFEFVETAANNVLTSGGIACTDKVSFAAKNGDTAYIKKVFLDGAYQSGYTDNKFTESGRWELILADAAGNEAYFCFFILTHSVKDFSYTAPYNYRITEVWYDAGDGVKMSYMQFVTEGTVCSFTENGTYSVVMSSSVTGDTANFTVSVNNVAPEVTLVGCAEGETTLNDVTVSGYKVGDTIEVYRDGQLVRSVKVLTSSTDAPVIKEGGDYTIVVRNAAGVETSLSFTRKHIPNTAGNVLIFVLIFALIAVVTIGLVYRNHSKSDE